MGGRARACRTLPEVVIGLLAEVAGLGDGVTAKLGLVVSGPSSGRGIVAAGAGRIVYIAFLLIAAPVNF